MLRFNVFGIPVTIHWFFWVAGALLGTGFAQKPVGGIDLQVLLIWMLVWFLSFMIHELGHAFAYRRFGGRPWIVLQSFYGFAADQGRYTRKQSIVIAAAGPVLEILCGIAAIVLLRYLDLASPYARAFFGLFAWICLLWGGLNLLPVLPLDGGRILEGMMGRGERPVAKVGMVVAGIVAVVFLVQFGQLFAGLLFGYLAYANFQRSRGIPTQFM